MAKKYSKYSDELLSMYFRDIVKYPVLNQEEEKALFVRYKKKNDQNAKNRIVLCNLRFVVREARKFATHNFLLIDLVEEGTIGLIKAAEKFDPYRNIHFISYAVWWIKQAIMEALAKKANLIKIPSHILNKLSRNKYMSEFKDDRLKRLKFSLIKKNMVNILYYQNNLDSESDENFAYFIPSSKSYYPEEVAQKYYLKKQINSLLNKLSVKERTVIKMRFGIGNYPKMSLKEIARYFDLTKERIRQIQIKSLNKLKTIQKGTSLKAYLSEY